MQATADDFDRLLREHCAVLREYAPVPVQDAERLEDRSAVPTWRSAGPGA
jgi:hypothetical protein